MSAPLPATSTPGPLPATSTPGPLDGLEVHPAADIFPALLEGPEFDELCADIAANGLQRPIVRTLRGAIIDGRRRAVACHLTGIRPVYRVWSGDPWRYVLTANADRFTSLGHRAMIAAAVAYDARTSLNAVQLRALCNVSTGSMSRAKKIIRDGVPALQDLASTGRVLLTTGARTAGLDEKKQNEFVEHAKSQPMRRPFEPSTWREWKEPSPLPLNKKEARYLYVQEPALQLIVNSLDGLAAALGSANGHLDPAITPDQAARWVSDLKRRTRIIRQLLALLRDRSEDQSARGV